jgi:hypothetical protein
MPASGHAGPAIEGRAWVGPARASLLRQSGGAIAADSGGRRRGRSGTDGAATRDLFLSQPGGPAVSSSKGLLHSKASGLDEMGARSQPGRHWRRSTHRPTHHSLNAAERPKVWGDSRSLCEGALGSQRTTASHLLDKSLDPDPGGSRPRLVARPEPRIWCG